MNDQKAAEKEFTIDEMRHAVRTAAIMGIRAVLNTEGWKAEWDENTAADKIIKHLEGL